MCVATKTSCEKPRDCSGILIGPLLIESLLKSPRIKSTCLVIAK